MFATIRIVTREYKRGIPYGFRMFLSYDNPADTRSDNAAESARLFLAKLEREYHRNPPTIDQIRINRHVLVPYAPIYATESTSKEYARMNSKQRQDLRYRIDAILAHTDSLRGIVVMAEYDFYTGALEGIFPKGIVVNI